MVFNWGNCWSIEIILEVNADREIQLAWLKCGRICSVVEEEANKVIIGPLINK